MSERIRGGYDDALYKSTFTLLTTYFTLARLSFTPWISGSLLICCLENNKNLESHHSRSIRPLCYKELDKQPVNFLMLPSGHSECLRHLVACL